MAATRRRASSRCCEPTTIACSRPATAAAASATAAGARAAFGRLEVELQAGARRLAAARGAARRGRRATSTGASGSATPAASRCRSPAMAASGMPATRPRPVVEGPSVGSCATTKRWSAVARMSISTLAPSRQPSARLPGLNGASAWRVRSMCHLSRIGPCGPSTRRAPPPRRRPASCGRTHPGAGQQAFGRAVEDQRVAGREADVHRPRPRHAPRAEPCSSTRTWPASVFTT